MFCHNCGTKIEDGAKFCHGCGNQPATTSATTTTTDNITPNPTIATNAETSKVIIKCGNCAYMGEGEKARSIIGQILAWLCVFFAPIITIIYFVATHKYKCPKCKSTFVGVRNKEGVFVSPAGGGKRVVIILVCILIGVAFIGLLSTLATVALGSARIKARDSKRMSDLKQVQTALELYHVDQNVYPASSEAVLGTADYACLNTKGWQPAGCFDPYMGVIPTDPNSGEYVYSSNGDTYEITASLEGDVNGLKGQVKLTPEGIEQQ